jgi:hypothetical protein
MGQGKMEGISNLSLGKLQISLWKFQAENFRQSLITFCVVKLATGSFISAKTYIYIYQCLG